MNQKQRGLIVVATLLIGAILISSCTFSLSNAPAATPTTIQTGIFVSPFPSVDDPMQMIAEFAQQTAAAQTAQALGGTPGTPAAASTAVTGTVLTPQTGVTATATTPSPSTPTNSGTTVTVAVPSFTPGGPTTTPGAVPSTYTLERGEWPYCIARRFNVNPDELLSLSGLTTAQSNALIPGQKLVIPRTGNPFPADRSWHDHPTTHTVASSSDTVYGIACWYGDIEPKVIADANGIAINATLTAGQKLNIP
ncbi:MAG: LysM peptidoglycan-binding domain-containing protein [Chloroflexota bacterium]